MDLHTPAGASPATVRRPGRAAAYLRFLRAVLGANLAAAAEYRANFLIQVLGMMLNNLAFVVFWKFLLDRTGPLGGYSFGDVMFLWAIAPASFGLATAVFGNCLHLARLIREGGLDVYLLQPKDPLLSALVSRSSISGWGDLAFGIVVFAVLGSSPLGWAGFLLFTLTGAVITVSALVVGETLAFRTGGGEGLSRFFLEVLLSLSLYPQTIFPQAMRWVFYTLVPTGFIVFLPLEFWRHPDPLLLVVMPAAALAFAVLARLAFGRGLRHYESGNRIGARN